jgi:hypothetical protein
MRHKNLLKSFWSLNIFAARGMERQLCLTIQFIHGSPWIAGNAGLARLPGCSVKALD